MINRTLSSDQTSTQAVTSRRMNNNRLNTPGFQQHTTIRDGSEALKSEINESLRRVKKAKYGHRISDIV